MTPEQFDEFIHEVIPQQLFHVEPKDRDDESGGQLDEVILVGLIANRPGCLKHKPLQWFLDKFLVSQENWDKMLKKNEDYIKNLNSENEEKELFCQILKDERENCPECRGAGEHVFGGSFGGPTTHTPCLACKGTGKKQ